jgi:hypothetical protein
MMLGTGSNSYPSAIAIADFNGDSQLDIAVSNYATKTVDMLFRNGQKTFVSQINHESGSLVASFFIAYGDFNDDGRSEIAVADDGNDNMHILVAYNIGSFTKPNGIFDC